MATIRIKTLEQINDQFYSITNYLASTGRWISIQKVEDIYISIKERALQHIGADEAALYGEDADLIFLEPLVVGSY